MGDYSKSKVLGIRALTKQKDLVLAGLKVLDEFNNLKLTMPEYASLCSALYDGLGVQPIMPTLVSLAIKHNIDTSGYNLVSPGREDLITYLSLT